jgi:hypothetical protein
MHRCLKSIQDDMIRNITGMTSFYSDPKDWASLAEEFKESTSFWFEANSLATSKIYAAELSDGWFRNQQIQTDPNELKESLPRLRKFLNVEQLDLSDAFHVRRAISKSVQAARELDDADESILAISAFLRLEEGQAVAEVDRSLIDRKAGPADWDERFFSTYKSQPRDADWADEQSWFEDRFAEEPVSAFTSDDWRRAAWWKSWEAVFSDPDQLRLKISCPDLSDDAIRNAALALKPVFSAPGRASGHGLEHAVEAMLDFVAPRSKRGRLKRPEAARDLAELREAG